MKNKEVVVKICEVVGSDLQISGNEEFTISCKPGDGSWCPIVCTVKIDNLKIHIKNSKADRTYFLDDPSSFQEFLTDLRKLCNDAITDYPNAISRHVLEGYNLAQQTDLLRTKFLTP